MIGSHQTVYTEVEEANTQTLFSSPGDFPEPEAGRPRGGWRSRRRLFAAGGAVLLAVAGLLLWRTLAQPATPSYGTASVQRAAVRKTITATGRLQALTTVDVGTQVSGTVAELFADFNSVVKKGQIIARLDPDQLQAQVSQVTASHIAAQANLQASQNAAAGSEAGVQVAEANRERMKAALDEALRNQARTRELVAAGVAARQDLDTAQSAVAQASAQHEQAAAQVTQARAQMQSARSQASQQRAQVQQAAAAVQLASVNLQHTVIRAPIDGVVVSRNVNVGQTVAASLQAPTLFVIANDLTRMQVLADVDEADVGQLNPGTRVTFTVDAHPNEEFQGRINQVRLAPQTVQNVVTYTAVIDVDNPELKLKPGMTANVTAIVAERQDVLTVPNAALRFRPENIQPSQNARPAGAPANNGQPAAGTARRADNGGRRAANQSFVWKQNGTELQRVRVQTGLSDGVVTEIVSGELAEGDKVAVPALAATAQRQNRPTSALPMGGGRSPRR